MGFCTDSTPQDVLQDLKTQQFIQEWCSLGIFIVIGMASIYTTVILYSKWSLRQVPVFVTLQMLCLHI